MNIYVTLDYELFFGSKSGNIDDCIINPTKALLDIVNPYNIKLVVFVDAGYLVKLEENKQKYPNLQLDYSKITKQIKYLAENDHSIQLHVHPHWENTTYDGSKWVFDTSQYRLHDFSRLEAYNIILKYKNKLDSISKNTSFAFRAGGWSAQPFSHIKNALVDSKILIDSTVFPKGFHESNNQYYDFKSINMYKGPYKFDNDLTFENTNGHFTEYPIGSIRVSPLFFWKFAFNKLKNSKEHLSYGKGLALRKPKSEIIRLMTTFSNSVVSIDGYKASLLQKALKQYIKNTNNEGHLVLIGHPKAFTPYSLKQTQKFIKNAFHLHKFKIFKN